MIRRLIFWPVRLVEAELARIDADVQATMDDWERALTGVVDIDHTTD